MRAFILATVLVAGCSQTPDPCKWDKLIFGYAPGDTEQTTSEIREHNERLRQACPGIKYDVEWLRAHQPPTEAVEADQEEPVEVIAK